MNERDEKRRQAYLRGYVDGKGGRSYARDYGKVIADTMDAVERAYHTGYTAGKYARQAEKERDDDEMPPLPEHSDSSSSIRIPGRGNRADIKAGRVRIGGCFLHPDNPAHYCMVCEYEWKAESGVSLQA